MSEKHYPYIGGSFDRIVFDGDGSVWVPESENAKLRELVRALLTCATEGECDECRMNGATPWHVGEAQLCDEVWEHLCELGIEVRE